MQRKEWELWTKCVNDTTLSGDRWYCSSIYSDLGPRWWTLGHRYFIRWYTQNIVSKTASFWFFLTFHIQIRAIPNCQYLHISWEINNRKFGRNFVLERKKPSWFDPSILIYNAICRKSKCLEHIMDYWNKMIKWDCQKRSYYRGSFNTHCICIDING